MRRPLLRRLAVAAAVVASGLVAVAPATALASWLQQSTQNISADAWEFNAVSCSSPSVCMAVGSLSAGTTQLLSETRSPAGWKVQSIPEPGFGSHLLGISCPKASMCVAVGDTPAGGGTRPLAERWNGSAWTIQSTPTPAGATFSDLNAVSCTSTTSCLAVGDTQSGSKDVPLAEVWNGSGWKIHRPPKAPGQASSALAGISCLSSAKCFAVGSSETNDIFKTLAEVWNGSKWQIQKTSNPVKGNSLNAVSCRSASSCLAVGSDITERWNGTSWSATKIARPRGTPPDLLGVSCTKAGPCYAVGGNFVQSIQSSVAELWNGSRWSVQPVTLTTSSDSSLLEGVSCTTATNCTAAGFYHDPVNGDRPLAEDFSIRWQDVSPMPLNGVTTATFTGVSCASHRACVAVGNFQTPSGFQSFSESWDGSSWTDARLLARSKLTSIAGVACPAPGDCIAVGSIAGTASTRLPVAEHWNGVKWTLQKTPTRKGAARTLLFGVSCATRTSCFAVGFATNKSNQQQTLAEHWNGKSWTITPTPDPAGADIELSSVSCPSVNSCVAIGSIVEGAFAQVWNGKSWKATSAVPNPKNAIHSQLDGVSCPAAGNCIAVGRTVLKSRIVTLAEHWNGRKWSPQKAAKPGGGVVSQLTSVSCSAGNACSAVGIESVPTGAEAIAESWTGKRWVLHPVDIPANAKTSVLSRVSCPSAVSCLATGQYIDTTSTGQLLAEHYS
jgi:hypothetical protein